MNPEIINFFEHNGGRYVDGNIEFVNEPLITEKQIFPVAHLSTLAVSGDDAATFLQGQLTCDINKLTEEKASFGALCNVKGRVIAPLIIFKCQKVFYLVLPETLADKVVKTLALFVLRAKVVIHECLDQQCLLGLHFSEPNLGRNVLPTQPLSMMRVAEGFFIHLPGAAATRYLFFGNLMQAEQLWLQAEYQLMPGNSRDWAYADLSSGIPWFNQVVSAEFIPQMINLDKLQGISFDKGCYIGQEIVARTHYLGKSKRQLALAECRVDAEVRANMVVLRNTGEHAGNVLAAQQNAVNCRLLLVLSEETAQSETLLLENEIHDTIKLIPFQ